MKTDKKKALKRTFKLTDWLCGNRKLIVVYAFVLATQLISCKKEQKPSRPELSEALAIQSNTAGLVSVSVPTRSEALLAMQVYNNHFYNQYGTYGGSYKAYYWKDDNHTGRMDFWTQQ